MPSIQIIESYQFSRQVSPLVKKTSLEIDSLEEFTLSVKPLNSATYTPELSNVRFLAIYNNGQGSGLKIKVGGPKPVTLTEPIIYTGNSASAKFKQKTAIVLENNSPTSKSVVMLVGSNLPKNAKKFKEIKKAQPKKKAPVKKKKVVKATKGKK